MQEGQQGEERSPPCLSHFLPFFPKDPLSETHINDRTGGQVQDGGFHLILCLLLLTCLCLSFHMRCSESRREQSLVSASRKHQHELSAPFGCALATCREK